MLTGEGGYTAAAGDSPVPAGVAAGRVGNRAVLGGRIVGQDVVIVLGSYFPSNGPDVSFMERNVERLRHLISFRSTGIDVMGGTCIQESTQSAVSLCNGFAHQVGNGKGRLVLFCRIL